MAWKPRQIKLFQMACRGISLPDEHRYLILGQCQGRAVIKGEISSKSPRLTNDDFEHCMAVVERSSGGQVKVWDRNGSINGGTQKLRYPRGYWQDAADNGVIKRARFRVNALVECLTDALADWRADPGARLLAWIKHSRCVAEDRRAVVHAVEEMDLHELRNLIDSLTALAKRHGVSTPKYRSAA